MQIEEADPKGLIRESYRIEGITDGECRSIFIDWALSLPAGMTSAEALPVVIAFYATTAPGHPMSSVLQAGLATPPAPARRGGRTGRMRAAGAGQA
jgi:hypothetical protein